jgi:uncharacterized protein (TIGR04141 family)
MTMLPLNAFLLRSYVTPATAWTDAAQEDVQLYYWTNSTIEALSADEAEILDAAVEGDIILSILRRVSNAPRWQEFIKNALNLVDFGGARETLGAVVFCAVSSNQEGGGQTRWVAWAFGTASRALRRSAQDPRFGLLAVLNLLVVPLMRAEQNDTTPANRRRAPRLREMSYRTTSPYAQQTGHRAARDIPVEGFKVDQASDLVATVGGTGADPALTTSTLLGGRSLRFTAGVRRIEDLVELASIAVDRANASEYKEAFSWIDNIRPVDDPELIRELRLQLVDSLIADPGSPAIDTILPDDLVGIDDENAIRYIVFPREHGTGQGRTMLTTAAIADLVVRLGSEEDRDTGLDAELRFLDDLGERIGAVTVLECLNATLLRGSLEFITYDGDFYSVDSSFVARINNELANVPASTLPYPPYRGQTEPAYNTMVGEDCAEDFVLLDRALIELPGEYGVEASDLVASSGALIHVKRKGKSSVLSHLFLQAANSCELLRRSPLARAQLMNLIRERAQNEQIVTTVEAAYAKAAERREEIEVAFAFLGDWRGKTIANLPLFSRISMVTEVRRVSNLGFRPTVALISSR